MRFLRLVLLFFVVTTSVSIEVTSATRKVGDFTLRDAAPNQMLRTSEKDNDVESRGFSIPGISTISEKFKAGATKMSESLKRIDERVNKIPVNPSSIHRAEGVNRVPVNPSSVHRAENVNKAPAGLSLNKLDEAVDVPAGYVALPGGPPTSRLNRNGLNRAEGVNKQPPRPNLNKIDEGVGEIPAGPGGDTLVSRLNLNRAEDVKKLPNKVDEGKDVFYIPATKNGNGNLAPISLVGDNFKRYNRYDLDAGRVELSTSLNLNKIDEGVGEILVAPSFNVKSNVKPDGTKIVLSSATAAKLNTWLKEGKSFDDSFDHLLLTGKARETLKLLDDPQFAVWLTYADDFMTKYPLKASSQMEAFIRRFGDEGAVEIFAVAKQVAGKSKVAEKLESALHQHWLDKWKDPTDVFTMMGLEKSIEKLLSESLFNTFTKFTDAYIARFGYFEKSAMSIVRTRYDDVAIVNLVLKAKKDLSTKSSAKQLEFLLRRDWHSSPDVAFKALKIAEVKPSELFRNKMFLYWMNWMDDFIDRLGHRIIYRTMLTRAFKEEDLRKAIAAAETNPRTKPLAQKLETELNEQINYTRTFRKASDIVPLKPTSL